jgi:nicotinate-nucleotide adenylyltransferase
MNIAIFGGAFNPVHNEHINIVKAAKQVLNLDKIIIIPTAISPHKSGKLFANESDRLNMCKLAFDGIDGVEVSDYEIKKGGVSYSYITCEHFKEVYPDDKLYFLVGADMLGTFPTWKNPDVILKNVTLAACARESELGFDESKERVEERFSTKVKVVPYVGKKVSSTEIRVLAALDEDISQFVSGSVGEYIKDNELYLMKNLLEAKRFLTKKRWEHSVRVAVLCAKYADRGGICESEAITISALHDVAKYLPLDSEYLKGCEVDNDVPEPVVHQFTGAYMASNYFGVKDEKLINAIKYHTSGRPNMTATDALLFLSDMLEEGRDFPDVDELRGLFKKDLFLCLYTALKHQVEYLKNSGKPVYNLTQLAYNSIEKLYN